jgi:hypothetical protein
MQLFTTMWDKNYGGHMNIYKAFGAVVGILMWGSFAYFFKDSWAQWIGLLFAVGCLWKLATAVVPQEEGE